MKTNGMTSAAAALRHWERRQEVVANNLANASTTGFKAERVFAREVGDAIPVAQTVTDRRTGTIQSTGQPLDLALDDPDSFFVIQTPAGERLTRGGSFGIDPHGQVVDAHGNTLLTTEGPLVLGPGAVQIDATGTVTVDDRVTARLRVERVPHTVPLVHEGGTHFLPDPARQPVPPSERHVRQGALEDSNVNTIGSLVDLIDIQRAYASVQKAITTLDGARGTACNDIGRPV
jgi:flagellar basal-body rod protein FlgG